MQIKELVIKSFKSFEFAKIPFSKGLHVVVGPNGSGKSNIVDALLFVFGSTSLKRLRVDRLSELINHNTKAKTARVRVVIEHNGEDIEIVREIDESGKSVFMLNEKRKALHEILSFLAEIGLDTEGHNTVQQGDVNRIINLNPEERRSIIDDVSGISLFDERKKEAEDNLKKVDEKLSKVNIALAERKPYVEQLRSEKEAAIKYKDIEIEENLYNYSLYKKQINFFTNEIEKEQKTIQEDKEKLSLLIKDKAGIGLQIKENEEKLERINNELISHSEKVQSTVGKRYSEVLANKEIVINNININQENVNYLDKENKEAVEALSILKKQESEVNGVIKNIKEKVNEKTKVRDSLKLKLSEDKKEFEKIKTMQDELYTTLSTYNKDLASRQDMLYDKKNKLNAFVMQKEIIEKKDKETIDKLKTLNEKKQEIEKEMNDLEKNILKSTKKLEDITKEYEAKKEDEQKVINEIQEKKINLMSINKDLSFYSGELKKKEGIKPILAKHKSYLGFLEDIVTLSKDEKTYYSSYVVLENDSDIKGIIKSTSEYNLSFVILSVLGIKKESFSDYFNKWVEVKSKADLSIDNFYFDGFSYKKISYKDSSKIEADVTHCENEISNLNKELSKIQKELEKIDEQRNADTREASSQQIWLNTQKELYKDVVEKISLEGKDTLDKTVYTKVTENLGHIQKEIPSLENEISEFTKKKSDLEEKLKKYSISANNILRDEFDDVASDLTTLEQSLMEKTSEEKILKEKIDNKMDYIEVNEDKIKVIKTRLTSLLDQKTDFENKINELKKSLEGEDSKKIHLFSEKSSVTTKITDLSNRVHSYDQEISELNLLINNSNINISTTENKINTLEQNFKLMDIKIDGLKEIDLSIEELNSNLRRIRRDKNALGNINFNAIESYDKLASEYDEIIRKCEVLVKEKEQVKGMLSEITMKKEAVFIDCFEKINKEFKDIIKKMSATLSGYLALEGTEPLTSKLSINLTKQGKTKDIDIMSGGEKTVTALAFIFALHAYKKAPFYILDEVDAALDDYNTLNLLSFVKDLSKNTTIISISHNSTSVSGANQVIGVTLQDHTSVIGLNLG